MNWCWFLNCSTGVATGDCERKCPVLFQPSRAGSGRTTTVVSNWPCREGSSAGLCHSQRLGQPHQQCIILWCLVVSYIPPQSSCFTFLTYNISFLFHSSLAVLGISLSFTSLFFSFVYSVFWLFPVFPPEATSFVLSCTFGTSSTTAWALYKSLRNQGEEGHRVEMRKRIRERLTSLQPLCYLWAELVLPREPRATSPLHTKSNWL